MSDSETMMERDKYEGLDRFIITTYFTNKVDRKKVTTTKSHGHAHDGMLLRYRDKNARRHYHHRSFAAHFREAFEKGKIKTSLTRLGFLARLQQFSIINHLPSISFLAASDALRITLRGDFISSVRFKNGNEDLSPHLPIARTASACAR